MAQDKTPLTDGEALAARQRRADTKMAAALADLVLALKADALDPELLAGAVLAALHPPGQEAAALFRRRGRAYFRRLSLRAAFARSDSRNPEDHADPRRREPPPAGSAQARGA